MMPVGEGIGPGIKSGLLAAEALSAASESRIPAGDIYLEKISPLISAFGKAFEVAEDMFEAAQAGGETLLQYLDATREQNFHLEY